MEQFWATLPPSEIVEELQKRVKSYDQHLINTGVMSELRDSYNTFYGDTKVRDVGQQGELKSIRVNHYASLIRNLVSLVSNNKPAWQPIASNTDSASQGSAILASGLLDFYMKDRRLDRVFRNACLSACFLKESWVSPTWDVTQGEVVHPGDEQSMPVHEGDLKFASFGINDVIRDIQKTDSSFDWLITREYVNKWDLVAQFPEFGDKIAAIDLKSQNYSKIKINVLPKHTEDEDQVPFYTFYFKPSASVPQGRMLTFIDDQYLTDGPLPYQKIPLVRLSAEETVESCFSHSPMMDVLPVQKAIDTLASILLTNNAAFGVQNVQYPKGSSISVSQVAGGLNLIEYDSKLGKLEPLQLTASAPETYKFFDMLVQQSQLLSGINDAIRGQTSAGTSGAALALLSQQAIQFANGLQQGYVAMIEDVGTMSIQILQRYANTKRVAVLTGKHNRPLLKEWSAQDLTGISRITIESGNALSKTASGRLTMADSMLQAGMVQRPEQYISVLTTGQLEPLYEAEQRQLLLIRSENEKLTEGQNVQAVLTDDHQNHILEHASVLSSPDVRENPELVAQCLAHIQEHLNIAQNMPPALAMLLKQQPLPQVAQPQGPQQPPEGIPPVMDGTNSIDTQAGEVKGPQLPFDPRTHERVQPINQ